ncbi:glutamate ABC transporter substrate-binding protein [Janibacter alkaliphilus]|uniref:Glutamate transport system substrate-binding protein n=1 Tax=Janibacter alkaliphilus TaxID=1069963 RepID=A0A852WYI8_9MICO|nr:glutamate ABC transporter substrate-binding protein [Janibacter alkaliphilus]NYG36092.1 glutamate transport system substrate-binding protein [Janibacter alkaliphilus]
MSKQRRFLALGSAAVLALGLTACGDDSGDGGSGGDGGGDTLQVGIKFDQPGLGFQEGDSYSGFDVDVANYVAEELGQEVEFVQAPSPQRETLLETGQVDMIFATYSITDERKEKVSFAGPYFIAGQDLLVAEDSDITGVEDLDGKRLCSVSGSTSAANVQEEVPGVQLREFDTYSECLDGLVNGQLDALTTDNTILAGYAAQEQYEGELKVVGNTFSEERYGVGIPKGDTELCGQINDALQKMVDDGAWQEAVDANFGPANFEVDEEVNPPEFDECS